MSELKPCPFCGGEVKIIVCDDEGNLHNDDYEDNPWSGFGYRLYHDETCTNGRDCPIARYEGEGEMGMYIYDTREEAIEAWNARADVPETNVVKWIPCSDRLPDNKGYYLCLWRGKNHPIGTIDVLKFDGEIFPWETLFVHQHNKVIAWIPLPEPYKGE